MTSKTSQPSHPPTTDTIDLSDRWFKALDQRRVGSGKEEWEVLVTGIHTSGPDCWIQLASAADETRQLLLCVSSQTTVDDALLALAAVSGGAAR
jgi:hypothetical protein